jgi:hypothetical protein
MKYRQGIQPAINLGQRLSLNSTDHISLTNCEQYNRKTQKEQVEEPPQGETDNKTNAKPNKRKTRKKQEKDKTNIVNKENKVKNSFFGAAAPAHSQEDQAEFKGPATRMGNYARLTKKNESALVDSHQVEETRF